MQDYYVCGKGTYTTIMNILRRLDYLEANYS